MGLYTHGLNIHQQSTKIILILSVGFFFEFGAFPDPSFHILLNWTPSLRFQINCSHINQGCTFLHLFCEYMCYPLLCSYILTSMFLALISWIVSNNSYPLMCWYVFTSMFPKSTHETLSQKLYEKFKNHKRFTKPKLSRTAFTIQHYAGDVSILHYNTRPVVQFSCFCLSTITFLFYFPR